MRFSLIVATLDRPNEIEKLLQSLSIQTFSDFEIIIVDQSSSDLTLSVANSFKHKLNINYIHSLKKGLSHARNLGILKAKGKIIAFPDDDCIYSSSVLELVDLQFQKDSSIQIVTTNSQVSFSINETYHNSPNKACELNKWNIFKTAISFTLFIKLSNNEQLKFDEQFGVGANFGSGEETDLLLRLLNDGKMGIYNPDIIVYHPANKLMSIERGYRYALGFGALHRKHISLLSIKIHFVIFTVSSVIKILLLKDVSINYFILKGKILGFLSYSKN